MEQTTSDIPIKSKKRFRILIVICAISAVVLKLSFIFFFIGMFPAMVAYVIDHDKNKYIFSTVAALNFAGVFPHMMDIYIQGGTFNAIKEKLIDAMVWFEMYSAAAMGWAIVWVSPIIAAMALEGVYKGRILHMENIQKKVEEDWGPEVTRRGN